MYIHIPPLARCRRPGLGSSTQFRRGGAGRGPYQHSPHHPMSLARSKASHTGTGATSRGWATLGQNSLWEEGGGKQLPSCILDQKGWGRNKSNRSGGQFPKGGGGGQFQANWGAGRQRLRRGYNDIRAGVGGGGVGRHSRKSDIFFQLEGRPLWMESLQRTWRPLWIVVHFASCPRPVCGFILKD